LNQKLLFCGLIVAIAAISISAVIHSTQADDIETQIVQTIFVSSIDLPIEYLEANSKFAIVGVVTKIEPVIYINPDRAKEKADNKIPGLIIIDKEILSDVTIKVKEDLFGNYKEKFITVRVPGGETREQITKHEGYDTFHVGERVILFVGNDESYNISEDNYVIIGAKQGTIRLGDTVDSKYATPSMSEKDMKNKIKSLKNRD